MVRVRGDEMIETEVRVVQKMDGTKDEGSQTKNAGTPNSQRLKQTLLKPQKECGLHNGC